MQRTSEVHSTEIGSHECARRRSRPSGCALLITLFEVVMIGLGIWGVMAGIQMIVNPSSAGASVQDTPVGEPIFGLSMISDGRTIWVRRGISEIVVVDLETELTRRIFGWTGRLLTKACVSQDGMTCLFSLDDKEIVIVRNQEMLISDPLPDGLDTKIALSSNGKIAIRLTDGTEVRRWDLATDEPVESDYTIHESGERIALDFVGDKLIVGTPQGVMNVYDARTGVLTQTLMGNAPLTADPVFSSDGTAVLAASLRSITSYNLRTGMIDWTVPIDVPVVFHNLAISPDGKWIAADGIASGIHILNYSDGKLYRTISKPHILRGLAFSPSSDRLYTGSLNGSISVWTFPDGCQVNTIAENRPHP